MDKSQETKLSVSGMALGRHTRRLCPRLAEARAPSLEPYLARRTRGNSSCVNLNSGMSNWLVYGPAYFCIYALGEVGGGKLAGFSCYLSSYTPLHS